MLSIIVAKSRNNVIGKKNELPWYLPADLKHFKNLTIGHKVILGRKTYESIINRLGNPLPDRKNIVITKDKDYKAKDCIVVNSIEEAIASVDKSEDAFIIGGASIYEKTINIVDSLYITEIETEIEGDAHFPEIPSKFHVTEREHHEADLKNCFDYSFLKYEVK